MALESARPTVRSTAKPIREAQELQPAVTPATAFRSEHTPFAQHRRLVEDDMPREGEGEHDGGAGSLEGRIEPGRVLDSTVGLDGYRSMNERESIKVMVNPK
jgi:hypothetical protein